MELSMMTFMLEFPVLFFKPGTKKEKAKEIESFIELTAETGYKNIDLIWQTVRLVGKEEIKRMLEKNGLISPVVDVACKYMKSMHYDDVVEVRTHITEFSGIRLCVAYEFYNKATGELCAKGNSSHCFIDPNGRPVIVKKIYPEFHELLVSLSEED